MPEVYGVGTQYVLPIKYTSTLTNKLLLEAGWSNWGYDNTIFLPQPGWSKPYGSAASGMRTPRGGIWSRAI